MVEYRCVISHMVEYLFVAGRISLRKQSTASQVLAVKGSAGQTIRVPATKRGLEPPQNISYKAGQHIWTAMKS